MPKPKDNQSDSNIQICKNCGAGLSDQYCSVCGQRAAVRIVSLWEVLRDLIDELFFLESRVWQTLVPLFFRPGMLTMEYLAGRRARYVPPLRLYIVLSVIFFVLAAVTDKVQVDADENGATQLVLDGQQATRKPRDAEATPAENNEVGDEESEDGELPESCTISDDWTSSMPFGVEIHERLLVACNKALADRGQTLLRALADDIPLMMIVFIPLLALSMKILYLFSRRYYVEHLLFFVHYHAFAFLMMTLLALSDELGDAVPVFEIPDNILLTAGVIYLFCYLFQAMRRVYGQSRFVTAVKYIFLSFSYVVCLALSFTGMAVYTALTL